MDGRLSDSTRALEQLCNTAAVLDTGTPSEVLGQLVALHLALDESDKPATLEDLIASLREAYSLDLLPDDVRQVVDKLQGSGLLVVRGDGRISIERETKATVLDNCAAEQELEQRVHDEWLAEVTAISPDIPGEALWAALEDFMQAAFARHGMQTALLLDPSFDTDSLHEVSLSVLQERAIAEHLPEEYRDLAGQRIARFFATAADSIDRVRYIGRLADTAHAFFILHVSPDVASIMRSGLAPVTIFLDTNFLFAFMGLHSGPFLEVANRLVEAVAKYRLPVKLRYHEATALELKSTLAHYKRDLGSRHWPQALSRAAVRTSAVSGVELEYHRLNAAVPTEVSVFFKPLQHFDVLLQDKGIEIYLSSDRGQEEEADLAADYRRQLTEMDREKPPAAIKHDARVLATVRALRSEARSTIEAGALLVTCDYSLFRFDNRSAKATGQLISVLLPNMLWQMLRSFVPTTQEYDKAFAETFAIPEFRTIQSRSGKAASKMLSFLATYSDLPEATAVRLLSNDVLLRQLAVTDDKHEFEHVIESEVVRLNQQLIEEQAALASQVEAESIRRAQLEQENERLAREKELSESAGAEASRLARQESEVRIQAEERERAAREQAERDAAEKGAEHRRYEAEQAARRTADVRRERQTLWSASVVSLLLIALHLVTWFGLRWPSFLVNHENALSMEILLMVALPALSFAVFVPKWRGYLLGGAGLAILIAIVQLL